MAAWSLYDRLGGERRCYGCAESLVDRPAVLEDGRAFCDACWDGLCSADELRVLFGQCRQFVNAVLGLPLPHELELVLLDPITLGSRIGDTWLGTLARNVGQFENTQLGARVLLECPLPRDLASEVLAHELGHAWFELATQGKRSETSSEGFAQWVAYHYCKHIGLEQQVDRILARVGPMGHGVKYWLDRERRVGRAAMLSLEQMGM